MKLVADASNKSLNADLGLSNENSSSFVVANFNAVTCQIWNEFESFDEPLLSVTIGG